MAKSMSFAAALTMLAVVIATLLETTTAETYTVGDTLGWAVPSDPTAYTTWAEQHTFVVGDVLVFNFGTGQHSVARVTKVAFDACNSANPISISPVGPTNITLDSPGEEYFFCNVGQHCSAGQKFAINVTEISPTPSPPSPPPSQPPVSGPPSPSILPPTPGPSDGVTPPPSSDQTPESSTPPMGSVPPPPTPSSRGASPPPPPKPNAARATNVASIFVIFISAAIAIMF